MAPCLRAPSPITSCRTRSTCAITPRPWPWWRPRPRTPRARRCSPGTRPRSSPSNASCMTHCWPTSAWTQLRPTWPSPRRRPWPTAATCWPPRWAAPTPRGSAWCCRATGSTSRWAGSCCGAAPPTPGTRSGSTPMPTTSTARWSGRSSTWPTGWGRCWARPNERGSGGTSGSRRSTSGCSGTRATGRSSGRWADDPLDDRGGGAGQRRPGVPLLFLMEVALTPLEFARRTRRLYGDRTGVVDGELRLTYEEFFARCDRWAAALQDLGVQPGDRVATIAPNTHSQLEAFYAVPEIGAVLVPINYRLSADDFAYILDHSGSTVVCVHPDYLDLVDRIRDQIPQVKHFVAFGGARDGWVDYETALASGGAPNKPPIDERDLLTINYTSGTTARPKGVMITHRNAYMNTVGTLLHLPIGVGEKYLWTLPMFHANGWTYTWTVTAADGVRICLPKVDPGEVFRLIREEEVSWLAAAPTVLISLANASAEVRGEVRPGVHVVTAGAPPAAATIERLERDFGWEVTHVYGLTETAPFITVCAPLPEHEGLSSAD